MSRSAIIGVDGMIFIGVAIRYFDFDLVFWNNAKKWNCIWLDGQLNICWCNLPSNQAGLASGTWTCSGSITLLSTTSSLTQRINVISEAPAMAGRPANTNDRVYDLVWSYSRPAIGGPTVNGIEQSPSRNPIACVAPCEPQKSENKIRCKWIVSNGPANQATSYQMQSVPATRWNIHQKCPWTMQ